MNVHIRDPQWFSARINPKDAYGVIGPVSAYVMLAEPGSDSDLSVTFNSPESVEDLAKFLTELAEKMRAEERGETNADSIA